MNGDRAFVDERERERGGRGDSKDGEGKGGEKFEQHDNDELMGGCGEGDVNDVKQVLELERSANSNNKTGNQHMLIHTRERKRVCSGA